MLRNWFGPKPEKKIGSAHYAAIVTASRQPALYGDEGVPDTMEGRFELIMLHTALLIIVLRGADHPAAGAVAQATFDAMFDDFDVAMRELGVGDSGIGKKIRFMAEGFYGRAKNLDDALASGDANELQAFLARNVLRSEPGDPRVDSLALYVNSVVSALRAQGGAVLAEGVAPAFPNA